MPDDELRRIVNNMIDAGDSDDDISAVVDLYNNNATKSRNASFANSVIEPDTFWGGVVNSLNPFGGGEALRAGAQGAKGFAKGATLDIPSSFIGGIQGLAGAIENPIEAIRGIPQGLRNVKDVAMRSGSEPEEFGRMMGQMTGQPLTTYGLAKGLPKTAPIVRAAGTPVEAIGRTVKKYQPISGMIPFGGLRTARNLERGTGRLIEKTGAGMKKVGLPPPTKKSHLDNFVNDVSNPRTGKINEDAWDNSPLGRVGKSARMSSGVQDTLSFADEITPTTTQKIIPMGEAIDPVAAARASQSITPEAGLIGEELSPRLKEALTRIENEISPEMRGSFGLADEATPGPITNASGESAASAESMSRNAGMRDRGERYVVFNKAGNMRPYDTADAVLNPNETYGIMKADGTFIKLEETGSGGKVTAVKTAVPQRRSYPGYKGSQPEPSMSSHGPTNEYFQGKRYDIGSSGDAQSAAKRAKARAMKKWAEKQKEKKK